MSVMHRFVFLSAALLVATAGQAMAVTGSDSPIKVNSCKVVPGTTTVSGYTAGYYPARGAYYWGDPYGRRYHQYPYSTSVRTSNPTLDIEYMNVGPHAAKEVEFGLVARGQLIAEVRDVGTFTNGAEIKHRFGLDPNVFPTGTGLPQCVALRVTHANGSVWTSPHLPRLKGSM